jgi:predicted small secreted protein
MLKRIVTALSVLAFATGFAGCNTMAGFGKDVEKVGEKVGSGVERAGEKIQDKAKQ